MASSKESEDTSYIETLKDVESFAVWDFQTKIALRAKEILGVVDGTESRPTEESALKKWNTKDAKAQNQIVKTVDKSVIPHIISCKTAKDMYGILKGIYQRDNVQQKCLLLQEFYNYQFSKEKDIRSNISHIQNLAFKLNQLEQPVDDNMVITKIIAVLPDEYRHFSSAWDSTDTANRTLNNLLARLSLEEQKMEPSQEKVSFKAMNNKSKNYKKSVVCYGCNKPGHIKSECRMSSEKKCCTVCKKTNHETKDCYFRDKQSTSGKKTPCDVCKKTNHETKDCYYKKVAKVSFLTEQRTACVADRGKVTFVVDSGSTGHMTNDKSLLKNVMDSKCDIKVAKKNQSMTSAGIGEMELEEFNLRNVAYVPDLSRNLLSVSAINECGGDVVFTKDGRVKICVDNKLIVEGIKLKNGLFTVDVNITSETLLTDVQNEAHKWHKMMGHLSYKNLQLLSEISTGMPKEVKKQCEKNKHICQVCQEAKQTRSPFNTHRVRADRPLQLIHTDVCGPISPATHDGKSYFLTFIDDYTHFCQTYLMKNKWEVPELLKEFVSEVEAQFNSKISQVRCDNGGEYVSHSLKNWCKERGIKLDYTIPHSPQLNGTAERFNRTLVEKTRSLLYDSNLKKEMWGEALRTSTFLMNRSPSAAVKITPAEMWFKRKPDLSRIRLFGSVVYAKKLGHLKKLDKRSEKAIFVGYSQNGYRLWDAKKRRIFLSRDVIFTKETQDKETNLRSTLDNEQESEDDENELDQQMEENETEAEDLQDINDEQEMEDIDQRHVDDAHNLRPRNILRKPRRYVSDLVYTVEHGSEALLTYEEAVRDKNWNKAVNSEMESLNKNNVWSLVDDKLSHGKEILTSRWIFKLKDNGKHKARLVVRGCQQKKDTLDFKDVYSPVVDTTSLRMLFALAAQENLALQTFDVKTAFLYGDLKEEVYMTIPEGYPEEKGKICKLEKALYGLRQAPHCWNKTLTNFLKKEGLYQMKTDQCIFRNEKGTMYLGIHVDDGVVLGNEQSEIKKLLKKLEENFEMMVNENPSHYLGMEIKRTDRALTITQTKYANEVVKRFGMENSKAVGTPIVKTGADSVINETVFKEPRFKYLEAIGSLLYLSCKTRPDLAYAVNQESRAQCDPSIQDVLNVKRTLRYINGTKNLGITYFNRCEDTKVIELKAYCDSDYAGDPCGSEVDVIQRKSTSGYVIMYAGGPISWCSRKQSVVALSTTEAEYIAATECCKEIKFLKALLEELTNKTVKVTMFIDNQSTIKIIKSGRIRGNKHIEVKFYFLKDEYQKNLFELEYIPSEKNIADVLTKPLLNNNFVKCRKILLQEN